MRRYVLAASLALLLASCRSVPPVQGTGVGYAWDRAWYGTPAEVADSVKFMHNRLRQEWSEKYDAIEQSDVINAQDGSVNLLAANNRFRDMESLNASMDRLDQLSGSLADYLGVELDKPSSESEKQADARRREFWKAIKDGVVKTGKEVVHE